MKYIRWLFICQKENTKKPENVGFPVFWICGRIGIIPRFYFMSICICCHLLSAQTKPQTEQQYPFFPFVLRCNGAEQQPDNLATFSDCFFAFLPDARSSASCTVVIICIGYNCIFQQRIWLTRHNLSMYLRGLNVRQNLKIIFSIRPNINPNPCKNRKSFFYAFSRRMGFFYPYSDYKDLSTYLFMLWQVFSRANLLFSASYHA